MEGEMKIATGILVGMIITGITGSACAVVPDESIVEVTLYADVQHPDADDGNEGTDPERPLRSFREAVQKAVWRLKEGTPTRIMLKPGTYRETRDADLSEQDNEAFKNTLLVIEGSEKGEVLVLGSAAEGWEPETWTLIDSERKIYRHDWSPNWGLHSEGFYSPPNILLHRREIVYVNGKALEPVILENYKYTDPKGRVFNEVGELIEENPNAEGGYEYVGFEGLDALKPGTFGVAELGPGEENYDNHEHPNSIFIRLTDNMDELTDAEIEVGMAEAALAIQVAKDNLVIRNLVFKHFATSYNTHWEPAVIWKRPGDHRWCKDWLIEDCDFVDNGGKCLRLNNLDGAVIRRLRVLRNGQMGMSWGDSKNGLMQDCDISDNNWRGEMVDYVLHTCGGFDVSGDDMTYERITANRNYGFGIRFDVHGTNIVMRDCEMKDNKSDGGLFHEIEWGPIDLINCRIENNVGTGFLMLNAQNVTIDSSSLRNTTESQWTFYNSPSRTTKVSVTDDTQEPITIVKNFTMRNSVVTTTGDSSLLIERKYRVGSHEGYVEMYQNEFTGKNNQYYNPDNRNVFEISTRFFVRDFTDLDGWKSATGSEEESVWGMPVNAFNVRRKLSDVKLSGTHHTGSNTLYTVSGRAIAAAHRVWPKERSGTPMHPDRRSAKALYIIRNANGIETILKGF